MATFGTYNFPTTFQGDTLDAVPIVITRTPTSLDALASVEIDFRLNNVNNCTTAKTLTSGSGITITNAATWAFTVNAITELDLAPGFYVYSIKCTDTNGRVKTYLRGSLTVLQPESR